MPGLRLSNGSTIRPMVVEMSLERGRTTGINTLVRLSSVPPGVSRLISLVTLLPTFSLARMGITRLLELLVDLERIGCLLIEISGLLVFSRCRREPAGGGVGLLVGLLEQSLTLRLGRHDRSVYKGEEGVVAVGRCPRRTAGDM